MIDRTDWPAASDQFSTRELASRSGVSATTIINWSSKDDDPLPSESKRGRKLFRWGDLLQFARDHPELTAARALLVRVGTTRECPGHQAQTDQTTFQAIAEYARAAAAAASDAALETAELHLKTVQSLRTAIAALDSALMIAVASNTVND